jgi:hypothetical protein
LADFALKILVFQFTPKTEKPWQPLSASDPLYVAAIPDWSHPNVGPDVVYWLKMGSMEVIPRTTINQGNSFCTELPPELTPSGEYQHNAEVNAFRFEGGTDAPFWVDRGTTIIP